MIALAPAELLEALRASGAEAAEPVRFRFVEALARRAEGHTGEARRLIDDKLTRAAIALGERFATARAGGAVALSDEAALPAGASLASPVAANPLAQLLAHIRDHAAPGPAGTAQHVPAEGSPRGELKSVVYFRGTWSQMRVDQQLADAQARVPENAAPFNPEFLAMRALYRLREIAPGYLRHWLSYLDALICLEQAGAALRPGPGKRASEGGAKRSGRKARTA